MEMIDKYHMHISVLASLLHSSYGQSFVSVNHLIVSGSMD